MYDYLSCCVVLYRGPDLLGIPDGLVRADLRDGRLRVVALDVEGVPIDSSSHNHTLYHISILNQAILYIYVYI